MVRELENFEGIINDYERKLSNVQGVLEIILNACESNNVDTNNIALTIEVLLQNI
ncbi:MAG: hypothetical protein ACK5LC_06935 [Coprobacillaceae bacterium]